MEIAPAVQAHWDQERRRITEDIRAYGVHLTYVSDELPDGTGCCRDVADLMEGAADGEGDLFAELFRSTGGPVELLPPRAGVPFAYTTGLFGIGHPELVVVGTTPSMSAELLNGVTHLVKEHAWEAVPGEEVRWHGRRLLVEDLPNPGMIIFETHHYYGRPPWEPIEAVQITWADDEGRYPWDPGHEPGPWGQLRPGSYRA